jgi:cytochrome bd ubiquinol oxidase subunit I
MPAKLSAIIVLVFVTVVNYVLYSRTIKQGTIHWGKIDFAAQFVLIFLAFAPSWIMSLMGAVRSLLKKYFHAYSLVSDLPPSRLPRHWRIQHGGLPGLPSGSRYSHALPRW